MRKNNRSGHDFKVLNLLTGGNVGGIEQLCKNVGLYSTYNNTFCFLFEEGKIYEEMQDKGLNIISLVNYGKRKWSVKRLAELLRIAKEYDIIVTHHCAKAVQLYYNIVGRILSSKKKVMTVHSCFEKQYNYPHKYAFMNWPRKILLTGTIHLSDQIIFVSNAGKRSYMNEFNIDDNKTTVIYNGVDIPRLEESDIRNNVFDGHYRIVFIGRLEKIKGIHVLIDALKILREKYDIELTIVGQGSYRPSLERQVESLMLTDIIRFEGMQRGIGKYLKNADIFVYPSIWQEVFGISIVEALAYGVPCVGFEVGGIPEIIQDGINGTIAAEKTSQGLSEAIERIIYAYESNKISKMKENCRRTAQKFSIENTVANLKVLYEGLLQETEE